MPGSDGSHWWNCLHEESIMPKLLRDALVLPIWEGAGNIMVLDMMRAAFTASALPLLFEELEQILNSAADQFLMKQLSLLMQDANDLKNLKRSEQEVAAKYFFEKLTMLYRIALLYLYKDDESKKWIEPAIAYIKKLHFNTPIKNLFYNKAAMVDIVAWKF